MFICIRFSEFLHWIAGYNAFRTKFNFFQIVDDHFPHYRSCIYFISRIWNALTDNYGNVMAVDWKTSHIRALHLPTLNLTEKAVSDLSFLISISINWQCWFLLMELAYSRVKISVMMTFMGYFMIILVKLTPPIQFHHSSFEWCPIHFVPFLSILS